MPSPGLPHLRAARTLAICAALMGSLAGRARAQEPQRPPTGSERAVAREELRRGMERANAGNWPEALEAFSRAHELVGLPEILFNIAGAQVQLGRLVEGAETYRRFLREGTSAKSRALRPTAEEYLADLEGRIPQVTIEAPRLGEGDSLTLDGRPLSPAVLGRPLPVDPGPHKLVALREDAEIAAAEFEVDERAQTRVQLEVPPRVPTPRDAASGVAVNRRPPEIPPDPGPRRRPRSRWSSPWLWTAVGVGVAVAGGVTTWLVVGDSRPDPYSGDLPPIIF